MVSSDAIYDSPHVHYERLHLCIYYGLAATSDGPLNVRYPF